MQGSKHACRKAGRQEGRHACRQAGRKEGMHAGSQVAKKAGGRQAERASFLHACFIHSFLPALLLLPSCLLPACMPSCLPARLPACLPPAFLEEGRKQA